MRVLIVLDINGVICNKTCEGNRISPYYCIQPIPGYMEFIEELSKNYNIAWFSSTTERNASKILKVLGLYNIPSIFKWYRDMTDNEGTVKSISKVKDHYPMFDRYIIVDDSIEKIQGNNENERILFTGDYSDILGNIADLAMSK
jgi:hypothetical protein